MRYGTNRAGAARPVGLLVVTSDDEARGCVVKVFKEVLCSIDRSYLQLGDARVLALDGAGYVANTGRLFRFGEMVRRFSLTHHT